ncbi:hypothetical protein OS493_037853 [Desmophyllum pertusum]|uniref:Peroxisomal membrane protein PMP34 n=1 Tax=Desmophyllum pertusum TaxID=174260 RepID=A0A9X0D071_9CNID|nr:hypothetical protein OS493_037853 [Desmophyllum pertusum]
MTVFSKTASFNDLVPLLPALDLPVTLKMLFSYRNFVHALAGAVGSVTAMTSVFSFGYCKNQTSRYSLYRGLLPVISSLYCSNFLYFYTFNGLKTVFVGKGNTSSSLQDLLFGYLAGIVNVVMTTPLWVVNTRLKLQGATFRTKGLECSKTRKYKGIIDGLQRISQEEGLLSLWSGTGPSLVLAGNPAIQFMVYEAIKKFMMNENKKTLRGRHYFVLGAIAKAVSTVITYPLQVAQCKQRSGYKTPSGKADIFSLLARLVREQGVKGLYKGLEAKLLQTVSTAALMFVAYEKIAAFIFRLLRRTQR